MAVKDGKPWTGRDGETRKPVNVILLVGTRTINVEFRDRDSAEAACQSAEKGDVVTLPVFVSAKDKGWLSVSGLNLRADES